MDNDFGYKTAKFIKRLYKIVNDPNIEEIQWNNSGKSFFIPNKERFLKEALPFISKTKEYSAFVRLLNHYGFQKVQGISPDCEEYFHRYFAKEKEENLVFITRMKARKLPPQEELSLYKKENQIMRQQLDFLIKNNLTVNSELSELKCRIEKQDKTINGLIEVLSKVFTMGMKSQKQMALKNETNAENNLLNIIKDKEIVNLEPQNKKILSDEELNHCLNIVNKKQNQFMLMQNKNEKKLEKNEETEEETLDFMDFF